MKKRKEQKKAWESSEEIAEKLESVEHWIEQHSKLLFSGLSLMVLGIAGYFGFRYYIGQQEDVAQREIFQAVYYFEKDSLTRALEGDGNNLGLKQIINDYGMTKAANLANYYAGAISLKQGDFLSAIDYLKHFSSDGILIQAHAYSLIGDAYMELEKYDMAASYYEKSSSLEPNEFFTPTYLLKQARAYEKLNDYARAGETYQEIIDQYWDSDEASTAKKFKAMLHSNS